MARCIAPSEDMAVAVSLARAATGCGSSSNLPANADGGEDAYGNAAGALSYAADGSVA